MTEDIRAEMIGHPHVQVDDDDKRPVMDIYTRSAQDAFRLASCAEGLGLGWVLYSYHCPTGSVDDPGDLVSEFHLVAWRSLLSETLPMAPDPVPIEDEGEAS